MKQFTTVAQMKLAHLQDGQTITTQGYYAAGDGGHAEYLIKTAAEYGGTPDEYGDHTLANGNVAVLQYNDVINVKWFGASPSASSSVNTTGIQNAIDVANANGYGTVRLGDGTYLIADSGSTINGRPYGLLLKSGVALIGQDMNTTTLKVDASQDIDLINTDRSASQNNITLKNMTLDGNEAAQGTPTYGFNAWLYDIEYLNLENIISLNPSTWGIRPEKCNIVSINNIVCKHSAESNSDGIHFVDTNNVFGGGIWIDTAGDDAFIIEALHRDVENYALTGVHVKPLNGLSLPARAMLIMSDQSVVDGAWALSNIHITGATIDEASGHGVVLTGASFYNVKVEATIKNSGSVASLYLAPGNSSYSGTLENCSFDVVISDANGTGVSGTEAYGTISGNKINAHVYNPGDGNTGVDLKGNYWTGHIVSDYDPRGTKTTFGIGVVINSDYNSIFVSSKDANHNLHFQGTANYNNIRIGELSGGITTDLNIAGGATYNTFTGGAIAGTITNSGGSSNEFHGTRGATRRWPTSLNMSTEGDGTVLVPHGLNGTPTTAFVQLRHSGQNFHFNVIGVDATNLDVAVSGATGTAITTGTYNVYVEAAL